jgi:hypothetical protein
VGEALGARDVGREVGVAVGCGVVVGAGVGTLVMGRYGSTMPLMRSIWEGAQGEGGNT